MSGIKSIINFIVRNSLKVTIAICIIIIVTITAINIFKQEKIIKSDSFNNQNEIISPSNEEKNNNISVKDQVNYSSYEVLNYIDKLFLNWKKLFDYFTFNSNPELLLMDEADNKDIVQDIAKLKNEFSRGNVDNLVKEYGDLIKKECNIYKIDWRLVLAIIRQESYFNPEAVSRAGAFGLMQLMPNTGSNIQNLLELEDTRSPQNNIVAGIYYFATLVSDFGFVGEDKYCFALSSYNAGLGRTIDVMTITNYFGDDYKKWEVAKENLKYLSSKYDSLHSLIWPQSKRPTYGSLENWKEPYNYVQNIMKFYEEYKRIFETNLKEEKKKSAKITSKKRGRLKNKG